MGATAEPFSPPTRLLLFSFTGSRLTKPRTSLGMDPPSPMDSVEIEDTFERAIQQSSRVINEKMPIRRINSLPLQLQSVSPSLKGQEADSHRYGIFGQQPSLSCQRGNKENMPEEGFEFKKPTKPASRCRVRSFNSGQSKDAFARRPSSAPALMLSSPPPIQQLDFCDSPMFLRRSSLTTSLDDEDDGFLEVLDDNMEDDSGMPMGMASLLTAPLVTDSIGEDSPVIRCRPRSLFRSPSMPSPVSRPSVKRPDCPRDENTPVRVKRRRSLAGTQVTTLEQNPESPRMGFSLCSRRSKSCCQTDIEKPCWDGRGRSNELIGGFSPRSPLHWSATTTTTTTPTPPGLRSREKEYTSARGGGPGSQQMDSNTEGEDSSLWPGILEGKTDKR
ncbi:M-phase inducer phosphatase 2-like [Morone saxatilis]|uniref:M-phase inducer phosphatase 2-like n=1 Tax=Morone saxatilis TaxID=34816 RepID=UPI0015E1D681|nr:M-phase inducer phosphatase 2-like [Morone saxatilis]